MNIIGKNVDTDILSQEYFARTMAIGMDLSSKKFRCFSAAFLGNLQS